MLQSRFFRQSPRLSRLLIFTIEQALDGAEQRLKEYSIALEVFGKPESFDPRLDSAVRVAARQLRAKIDTYYLTDGAQDPVLVRYRPGEYMPRFYLRGDAAAAFEVDMPSPEALAKPALVVEKDRGNIRNLTDSLDGLSYPIVNVVDSAEKAIEIIQSLRGLIVLTGLTLTGSMSGTDLTRALRDADETAVVAMIPGAVQMPLLQELLLAEPDAMLYEPVRASDLRTALRLAVAKRAARTRAKADGRTPEMASCA
jgi:CheY-like chemotaxis protein